MFAERLGDTSHRRAARRSRRLQFAVGGIRHHPNMPWVATEAWVGEILSDGTIGNARRVAGGSDESVFQPEWSPDGDLYFISDQRGGWWNLYRERNGVIEPMAPMDAEFGRPQWQFGMSTYAFESAERLICCFVRDGIWKLAQIDTRTKRFDVIPTEFTGISQLRAGPGRVVFLGGTPSEAAALVDLSLGTGTHRVIRRSLVLSDEVRRYVSTPEPIAFPTDGGETAHAFYYPPFSPEFTAPEGEKVPVLVKIHGGPTSSASSTLSLAVQYWTSRGIGVLDVNHRGSTGYGRAYRLRLERLWGVVDVQDCVHGARYLIEERNADPARLMISGGSAGGCTTLRALTPEREKTFSGGASYYGVSDLAALARDTHKFESHYLDWLIGPYPREQQTYADRSPINHINRLSVPVIFFQGADDKVVPPSQTELMVAALANRGIPVGYFLFGGVSSEPKKPDSAERRQVTVQFSDLVGSTALVAAMDPEDLREVIPAYKKCVSEAVRRFDGYVAKYLGDGIPAYFGYPHAHEDDAERAVRAGLELIAAVAGLKTHPRFELGLALRPAWS
jgi:dipeptidyl aminopeptidase/acylaminoacyl peptidase